MWRHQGRRYSYTFLINFCLTLGCTPRFIVSIINKRFTMETVMKIGEFARQLGVSTDTLRYYEKHGLLTPSSRSEGGISVLL